jgi:hypothetical protein
MRHPTAGAFFTLLRILLLQTGELELEEQSQDDHRSGAKFPCEFPDLAVGLGRDGHAKHLHLGGFPYRTR